jgi:hypothetical protein
MEPECRVIRPSDFGFPSGFGIRLSDLGGWQPGVVPRRANDTPRACPAFDFPLAALAYWTGWNGPKRS